MSAHPRPLRPIRYVVAALVMGALAPAHADLAADPSMVLSTRCVTGSEDPQTAPPNAPVTARLAPASQVTFVTCDVDVATGAILTNITVKVEREFPLIRMAAAGTRPSTLDGATEVTPEGYMGLGSYGQSSGPFSDETLLGSNTTGAARTFRTQFKAYVQPSSKPRAYAFRFRATATEDSTAWIDVPVNVQPQNDFFVGAFGPETVAINGDVRFDFAIGLDDPRMGRQRDASVQSGTRATFLLPYVNRTTGAVAADRAFDPTKHELLVDLDRVEVALLDGGVVLPDGRPRGPYNSLLNAGRLARRVDGTNRIEVDPDVMWWYPTLALSWHAPFRKPAGVATSLYVGKRLPAMVCVRTNELGATERCSDVEVPTISHPHSSLIVDTVRSPYNYTLEHLSYDTIRLGWRSSSCENETAFTPLASGITRVALHHLTSNAIAPIELFVQAPGHAGQNARLTQVSATPGVSIAWTQRPIDTGANLLGRNPGASATWTTCGTGSCTLPVPDASEIRLTIPAQARTKAFWDTSATVTADLSWTALPTATYDSFNPASVPSPNGSSSCEPALCTNAGWCTAAKATGGDSTELRAATTSEVDGRPRVDVHVSTAATSGPGASRTDVGILVPSTIAPPGTLAFHLRNAGTFANLAGPFELTVDLPPGVVFDSTRANGVLGYWRNAPGNANPRVTIESASLAAVTTTTLPTGAQRVVVRIATIVDGSRRQEKNGIPLIEGYAADGVTPVDAVTGLVAAIPVTYLGNLEDGSTTTNATWSYRRLLSATTTSAATVDAGRFVFSLARPPSEPTNPALVLSTSIGTNTAGPFALGLKPVRVLAGVEYVYELALSNVAYDEVGPLPAPAQGPARDTAVYTRVWKKTDSADVSPSTPAEDSGFVEAYADAPDVKAIWVSALDAPSLVQANQLPSTSGWVRCVNGTTGRLSCTAAAATTALSGGQARWMALELGSVQITDAAPRGRPPSGTLARIDTPYNAWVRLKEHRTGAGSASATRLATRTALRSRDTLNVEETRKRVEVRSGNTPPVFTSTPTTAHVPGRRTCARIIATDTDGDELRFSLGATAPAAVSTATFGTVSCSTATTCEVDLCWTPRQTDSGTTLNVPLVVRDLPWDASGTGTITFNVAPNTPPTISAPVTVNTIPGRETCFDVTANDADLATRPDERLDVALTSGPTGGLLGTTAQVRTWRYCWTPTISDAGFTRDAVFTATDAPAGASASATTKIVVRTNAAPTCTAVERTVRSGQSIDVDLSTASGDTDGDALSHTLVLPAQTGIALSGASLHWVAPGTGDFTQVVTVTDQPPGTTCSLPVTLHVLPNRPPTIVPGGPYEVRAGGRICFAVNGSDPDGDTFTSVTHDNAPSTRDVALDFDGPLRDTFSGTYCATVDAELRGGFDVTFRGTALPANEPAISVRRVNVVPNRAPIISFTLPAHIPGGVEHCIAATLSDPDGDRLDPSTFLASSAPVIGTFRSRLTIDAANPSKATAEVCLTPGFTESGPRRIAIAIADQPLVGNPATGRTERLTEIDPNRAPVFDPVAPAVVVAGREVCMAVVARDPDGDPIELATPSRGALREDVSDAPASEWHGRWCWTPTVSELGSTTMAWEAEDLRSHLTGDTSGVVLVRRNSAPEILDVAPKVASVGFPLCFEVRAADRDGDEVVPVQRGGIAGSTFTDLDVTRPQPRAWTFCWTANEADIGGHVAVFEVKDVPDGETDEMRVPITVRRNLPPAVDPIDDLVNLDGAEQCVRFRATDPESGVLAMTFPGLPASVKIENTGNGLGRLCWTPGAEDPVRFVATVVATDDGGLTDAESFVWRVNRPPVVVAPPRVEMEAGVLSCFRVSASDPDGDLVELSAAQLATEATFVPAVALAHDVCWRPSSSDVGDHVVTFTAADVPFGRTGTASTTVVVSDPDLPPVLDPIETLTVVATQPVQLTVTGHDPDGDAYVISAENAPDGVTVTGGADAAAVLAWTPSESQLGDHVVTWTITANGKSASRTGVIVVLPLNHPPEITSQDRVEGEVALSFGFTFSVTDPDGDAVSCTILELPQGAVFDAVRLATNWTPGLDQAGEFPITLRCTDGELIATKPVVLVVKDVPVDRRGGGLATCGGCASDTPSLAAFAIFALLFVRRRRAGAAAVVALVLGAGAARAESDALGEGGDIQRFQPEPTPLGGIGATSGEVLEAAAWGVGLHVNYARNPLVLRRQGERIANSVMNHLVTQLHGGYGLGRSVELSLALPIVAYQDTNDLQMANLPSQQLGDLRVLPRFRLLTQWRHGFALTVSPSFTVPLGGARGLAGEPGWNFIPEVNGSWRNERWMFAANASVRIRPKREAIAMIDMGTEAGLRLAAGRKLNEDLQLMLELTGGLAFATKSLGTEGNPLEAMLGLRRWIDSSWALDLAAGAGILSAPGTPDFRIVGGVTYGSGLRPPPFLACKREGPNGLEELRESGRDADGDGLDDACDLCPAQAETPNEYMDADGCSDDKDSDGVHDGLDQCLEIPGPAPTGCPDRDGDGLLDQDDQCPDVAGPRPTGCPDTDGDGLIDPKDQCATVAEDKDGFEDEDGCPDLDDDKDGLPDTVDKCRLLPEDKDGFEDTDGCPDPDNDKDGVADADDKCPTKPETINGIDDDDGCPDKGATLVVLKKEKIEILDKVYFDTDKDTIQPRSFNLLEQVAMVIKAHAEIPLVRVEGHTDDVGGRVHNIDLSQRRAESVKRFLVKEGVDPARLTPQGFAFDRPLVPNTNAKNRATNRRVEFRIVTEAPAPATP